MSRADYTKTFGDDELAERNWTLMDACLKEREAIIAQAGSLLNPEQQRRVAELEHEIREREDWRDFFRRDPTEKRPVTFADYQFFFRGTR